MLANQVIPSCDSTNDLARELGEAGAPHGTWISARLQNRGRGRLGREWESSEGNLFFSLVARIENPALWSWIPLTAAVAVLRAVSANFPEIAVRIKWPNDLWVEHRKLGGILCEGSSGGRESFIVIGIGLNCARAPEILERPATSLSDRLGRLVTADEIRESVRTELMRALEDLRERGSADIARDYARFSAIPMGGPIQWTSGTLTFAGQVLGLGTHGELRVQSGDGKEIPLYAEEVRIARG